MKGDMKGARKLFEQALAWFPDHYIANYSVENHLRLEGRPRRGVRYMKRAIRALDKALRIQPDDPIALKDREEALAAISARDSA